jgi:curved DNA-binding protein CbpA
MILTSAEILGIPKSSTKAEIKKAYHKVSCLVSLVKHVLTSL